MASFTLNANSQNFAITEPSDISGPGIEYIQNIGSQPVIVNVNPVPTYQDLEGFVLDAGDVLRLPAPVPTVFVRPKDVANKICQVMVSVPWP